MQMSYLYASDLPFKNFIYSRYLTSFGCNLSSIRGQTHKKLMNSMGYLCCERSGGPKLAFHWSAACPGWQPLWWGVISFQNFRSLKLGLYFCVDFLASSDLIGYIDLTDYYEIWPKCSLVINAKKGVRLFWYCKYFLFWALSCAEDQQIFNLPTSK